MFRERVNLSDFESAHFARQLLERLGWAVEDADQAEHPPESPRRRDAQPTATEAAQTRAEVDEALAGLSGQQAAKELEGATLR